VNVPQLCLSVLGGHGIDVVSKAVTKCLKVVPRAPLPDKIEQKKEDRGQLDSRDQSPLANLYPMYPPAPGFPYGAYNPYPMFNGGAPMRGNARPYAPGPRFLKRRAPLKCHFCDSADHLVKDCPSMKEAKKKIN
jgi:hypothetical protein